LLLSVTLGWPACALRGDLAHAKDIQA
jgi:hypothetical protein